MAEKKAFVVLCDKEIESQVRKLVAGLEKKCGHEITFKTMDDVPLVKGKTKPFGEKFKQLLVWAQAVIIVSSKNFAEFINNGKKDYLPEATRKNYKDVRKVFTEYLSNQINTIPSRLVAVSVNGDETLPTVLTGMRVITDNGNYDAFVNQICEQIATIVNL